MADKNLGFIINETVTENVEFKITSSYKDRVIAEGTLQDADNQNRNRRCYAAADLRREIYGPRLHELITTGNFKGEAGHPSSTELARQQKVDPTLEQVLYIKLWMENNLVKAQYMGTNNELGNTFDKDLRMGQKPSFSVRALGSIENRNGKAYVRNLRIITYDRVYYPSHKAAYTEKLVSENAALLKEDFLFKVPDVVTESGNVMVDTGHNGIIVPITNKQVVDYVKEESDNLNIIIDNFNCIYETANVDADCKHVNILDKDYNIYKVPIEKHIQNEMMNYFCKL